MDALVVFVLDGAVCLSFELKSELVLARATPFFTHTCTHTYTHIHTYTHTHTHTHTRMRDLETSTVELSMYVLLINKSYVHTLLQYQEGREAAGALALSPLSFALSPLSSPSLLSLSLIPLPLSFPSPPPARVEERTQNAARCNASCLHPRSCVLSCNRLASAVAATGA